MPRQRNNPDRPQPISPNIHSSQWEGWKRGAARGEYALDSFKVLNAAGKVTRQRYLEMLLEMEEKFPGKGWREQMNELYAYYHKRGLSLKDFPIIREIGGEVDALVHNPPF